MQYKTGLNPLSREFIPSYLPTSQKVPAYRDKLSSEIWRQIFSFAAHVPPAPSRPLRTSFEPADDYDPGNTRVKRSIMLVCKKFHEIACPLLYEHLRIYNPRQLALLAQSLDLDDPNPQIASFHGKGRFTKRLDIRMCIIQGYDSYDPLDTERVLEWLPYIATFSHSVRVLVATPQGDYAPLSGCAASWRISSLLSLKRHIRRVEFLGNEGPGMSHIQLLLESCPLLEAIIINAIHGNPEMVTFRGFPRFTHFELTTLELPLDIPLANILGDSNLHPRFPSLTRLRVAKDPENTGLMCTNPRNDDRFLNHHFRFLTSLTTFRFPTGHSADFGLGLDILSLCPNLEEIIYLHANLLPFDLVKLRKPLAHPKLVRFGFEFHIRDDCVHSSFDYLNVLLTLLQKSRLPRLECIRNFSQTAPRVIGEHRQQWWMAWVESFAQGNVSLEHFDGRSATHLSMSMARI
ncbi:hypothetical protein BOTBODRAFT_30619 [Botryobasidium botryosum FD-172 SS1]|uniref:F-box domain-containing protein n=1 Tax=Botryobasidium botryosum (strain FD-172 SS1) TaxID=930990 RepID=A0A067MLS2_BOTB1|nr:hypothetical protein BOTBODRAFT_30619 [Botryobasidium botryosum FD-172 SS1]